MDISEFCFTCGADVTTRDDTTYGVCATCETTMGYGDYERGQVVKVSGEYQPDDESALRPGMQGLLVARYPTGAFGVAMQPDGYEHPVPFSLYAHEIEPATS